MQLNKKEQLRFKKKHRALLKKQKSQNSNWAKELSFFN